ncbi:MAG: DUF2970 domain-containing protein [Gammaproteobacteria bacterium]|jgi:hypothetical protein|nr:DUF2970 domain-containing protein [Gammaproteobacteria bacterium]MBT5723701.1 DUF2970 domain-containing protein [Gammaproteobacteria bacterium]MBT6584204.1 DUF2970 domain-containing protein [Gammaproteobacteria bacterium]MDG1230850.1 DUF2970 domain-containing protein [Pseudomonadales bacterium]
MPMRETSEKDQMPAAEEAHEPRFWEVVMSVLAAALGVQNSKNRERDFTRGNPLVFIAAGLIFTILFVLTLIGVVNLIL